MNVITHTRRRFRPTARQRLHHWTHTTLDAAGYGCLLFAAMCGALLLAYLTLTLWFDPATRPLFALKVSVASFGALTATCGLVHRAAVTVATGLAHHSETEDLR